MRVRRGLRAGPRFPQVFPRVWRLALPSPWLSRLPRLAVRTSAMQQQTDQAPAQGAIGSRCAGPGNGGAQPSRTPPATPASPVTYLSALESGAPLSAFPAPVYARGFLREYARYLGLDPEPLVDRFWEGDKVPDPVIAGIARRIPRGSRHGDRRAASAATRRAPLRPCAAAPTRRAILRRGPCSRPSSGARARRRRSASASSWRSALIVTGIAPDRPRRGPARPVLLWVAAVG